MSKNQLHNRKQPKSRASLHFGVELIEHNNCVFCKKMNNAKEYSFATLLNKALYTKYSSAQNYYFTKAINDIIEEVSSPAVVTYVDLIQFNDEQEFLKKCYPKKDNKLKMVQMTEYYKYHKDIPRLFMDVICNLIHKFHDKKRRIEYCRIKRHLGIVDQEPDNSICTTKRQGESRSQDFSVGAMRYLLKGMNCDRSIIKPLQQVSCTILLRDMLNSILKLQDHLMEPSFFEGASRYLSDSVLDNKQNIIQVNPKTFKKPNNIKNYAPPPPILIPGFNLMQIQTSPRVNNMQPLTPRSNNQLIKSITSQQIMLEANKIKSMNNGAQTSREQNLIKLQQKKDFNVQKAILQIQNKLSIKALQRSNSLHQDQVSKYIIPVVHKKVSVLQSISQVEAKKKTAITKEMSQQINNEKTTKEINQQINNEKTTKEMNKQINNEKTTKEMNKQINNEKNTTTKELLSPRETSRQIQINKNQNSIIKPNSPKALYNHFVQYGNSSHNQLKQIYQQNSMKKKMKSSDAFVVQSQPSSPQRPHSNSKQCNDPIKWGQSIKTGQSSKPKRQMSIYTLNQNNLINVFMQDYQRNRKSSVTMQSPLKLSLSRKIYDCEQTPQSQKLNQNWQNFQFPKRK